MPRVLGRSRGLTPPATRCARCCPTCGSSAAAGSRTTTWSWSASTGVARHVSEGEPSPTRSCRGRTCSSPSRWLAPPRWRGPGCAPTARRTGAPRACRRPRRRPAARTLSVSWRSRSGPRPSPCSTAFVTSSEHDEQDVVAELVGPTCHAASAFATNARACLAAAAAWARSCSDIERGPSPRRTVTWRRVDVEPSKRALCSRLCRTPPGTEPLFGDNAGQPASSPSVAVEPGDLDDLAHPRLRPGHPEAQFPLLGRAQPRNQHAQPGGVEEPDLRQVDADLVWCRTAQRPSSAACSSSAVLRSISPTTDSTTEPSPALVICKIRPPARSKPATSMPSRPVAARQRPSRRCAQYAVARTSPIQPCCFSPPNPRVPLLRAGSPHAGWEGRSWQS